MLFEDPARVPGARHSQIPGDLGGVLPELVKGVVRRKAGVAEGSLAKLTGELTGDVTINHVKQGDYAAASLLLEELKGRARDYYVPGTSLALKELRLPAEAAVLDVVLCGASVDLTVFGATLVVALATLATAPVALAEGELVAGPWVGVLSASTARVQGHEDGFEEARRPGKEDP